MVGSEWRFKSIDSQQPSSQAPRLLRPRGFKRAGERAHTIGGCARGRQAGDGAARGLVAEEDGCAAVGPVELQLDPHLDVGVCGPRVGVGFTGKSKRGGWIIIAPKRRPSVNKWLLAICSHLGANNNSELISNPSSKRQRNEVSARGTRNLHALYDRPLSWHGK